jgi:carbon-monoxide dehydrogenase catalytic subunit
MSEETKTLPTGPKGKGAAEPPRTCDPAAMEVLNRCRECGIETAFERYQQQTPQCAFGLSGLCCRICIQGPCRINPKKPGEQRGICGATDYTIVARNIARMVAGGSSCHSDHGRHQALVLKHVAEGKTGDYTIADPAKLRRVAKAIGLKTEGKADGELAKEVAIAALEDFGRYTDDPCTFLWSYITEGRKAKFTHCNIAPSSIDRAVVENLHQTAMGMDADPVNIIFGALKTALADYTGMHLATDISDILFGTPEPIVSQANLGVIDPEYVNIATHGHNPTMSSLVVDAARLLADEAKAVGAKGVNVVGICCTGNELLSRKGVYMAANAAAQELAVITGALDGMIVDVQCIAPALGPLTRCYHTKLMCTSPIAKVPGSLYFDFREDNAMETAKTMVRVAIGAFRERDKSKIAVPGHKSDVVVGFSLEALLEILGKVNPDNPVRVINEAIEKGELRGVCLFAGCNNTKQIQDFGHTEIAKEMAKNNVLILATGCGAVAFGKHGLLHPSAVDKYAGDGLKAFLKRLEKASGLKTGLPLIFHMGSCVDNTRAADLCTMMAKDLGVDIPKVPFAASAPEAMHEKAVAIGSWAVAMGLPVHVGVMPYIEGSQLVYGVATQIAQDVYGGYFILEPDPAEGAKKILAALDYRTWKLRIHKATAAKFGTTIAAGW